MSKVMAIIDKPKNCDYCIFAVCKYSLPLSTHRKGYYCKLKDSVTVEDFDFDAEVHLSNCPLQEVPEKREYKAEIDAIFVYDEVKGWNACIDKILKGGE